MFFVYVCAIIISGFALLWLIARVCGWGCPFMLCHVRMECCLALHECIPSLVILDLVLVLHCFF